jgi:UPF0716 family protein affecting phage T7 exclusion
LAARDVQGAVLIMHCGEDTFVAVNGDSEEGRTAAYHLQETAWRIVGLVLFQLPAACRL